MKRKLFWMLHVILNSARFMLVLMILEKATGYCLDWPNGSEAWPVLAPVAMADEVVYRPYVEIEIEKAASQGTG